jgi:hypothetical protein
MFHLPNQPNRRYPAVECCIYCGRRGDLTDEHIIPLGLGGRWVLPGGSCRSCAAITGAFEGVCLRTMLGPLRLYYDLPSRRKSKRPETLPLKVRLTPNSEWTFIKVDQEIYPFLILFPNLNLPDELSGKTTAGERGAKVKTLWIRAASFRDGIMPHLERLAVHLRVAAIEPQAQFVAPPFFRMLAKIAYAFATAELGLGAFTPFLLPIIVEAETSNSVQFIGGTPTAEQAGRGLHELSLIRDLGIDRGVVAVRIRLLSPLETPTYFIAVGRQAWPGMKR